MSERIIRLVKEAEQEALDLPKIKFEDNLNPSDLDEIIEFAIVDKEDTFNEDGSFQCEGWKRRSLTDLLRISKSYFPDATMKDVVVALRENEGIFGMRCNDIQKYVFWYDELIDEDDYIYRWEDDTTEIGVDMYDLMNHFNIYI